MYNGRPTDARGWAVLIGSAHMSIFRYMFDSDWQQRRDIEELRDQQYRMAVDRVGGSSGTASQKWVSEVASEVKELAATVHVLMQMLAETGGLDVAEVERRVDAELAPKPKAKQAQAERPAKPQGPITDETCTKCAITDRSSEMVRVGSAWFCRPCARNP